MGAGTLRVDDVEVAAGEVAGAVDRLRELGVVVVRSLLPPALVAALAAGAEELLEDCRSSPAGEAWHQLSSRHRAVFSQRAGRWRVFPKLQTPFDAADAVAAPMVLDALRPTLGRGFRCAFVSTETCEPGAKPQSPHRQFGGAGRPPARVVLLHVALAAGSPIELWPGRSHRWPADAFSSIGIADDVDDGPNPAMEGFVARLDSVVPRLAPGDVVLRDAGLLHRGTANPSSAPRTSLVVAYARAGHAHEYVTAVGNLQRPRLGELDPRVRPLFEQRG